MRYVSGSILTREGFIDGHVGFENGMVVEVDRGPARSPIAEGTVIPTFVNSHTHIADHLVPVDLSLSIEELVAPPNGLKHRILRATNPRTIMRSTEQLRDYMLRRGTSQFIDFREGGVEGAKIIAGASRRGARPVVLGRPRGLDFDVEEVSGILEVADGVGLSSLSDWGKETMAELSAYVRSRGKVFALHASERVREDIDTILDMKPSFLVHLTEASDDDMAACAEEGVPVVVCPRSSLFFGKAPPLRRLLKAGVLVAIGTDNAMLGIPDMFTETEFAGRILRLQGAKEIDCVVDMAVHNGRKILNPRVAIGIEPGAPCDFMVLGRKKGDAATNLVFRSGADDPHMVCLGERIWKRRR